MKNLVFILIIIGCLLFAVGGIIYIKRLRDEKLKKDLSYVYENL